MLTLLLACAPTAPPRGPAPPPSSGPVRFVAIGDTGRNTPEQTAVAAAMGRICAHRTCDFALLLGDNLYPKGMETDDDPRMTAVFTDVYGDLGLEFMAVLGNHDYGGGEAVRALRQLRFAAKTPTFTMPDRYYTFDRGAASFFALDTDWVFFNGEEEQAAWLDTKLAASDARWKVAFGHHPWRSNGKHGNAGTYEGWGWVPYVSGNALRRLFEGHVRAADLYVSGHDHNLQVMRHEGVPLVVSGGGSSARGFEDRGNPLDLGFAVPGFAWIELDEVLKVALYDENGTLLGEQTYPHPREAP